MRKYLALLCIVVLAFSLMACTTPSETPEKEEAEVTAFFPSETLEEGQSMVKLREDGATLSFKSIFPSGLSGEEFRVTLEKEFLKTEDVSLLNYQTGEGTASFDFNFASLEAIRDTNILMSKDTLVNVASIIQEQSESGDDGFTIMASKEVLYHYDTDRTLVTADDLKEAQDKPIVQIQGSNNAYFSVPGKILMTNKDVTMIDDYTFFTDEKQVLIVIYEAEE